MTPPTSVGCFSYLARVHTLYVQEYPPINYGVDVLTEDRFLAGDGPLVAGFLRALGHPATLTSNQVGDDEDGQAIGRYLADWGVTTAPSPQRCSATRVNIVVCDSGGNRTWFSGLRGVAAELAQCDLDGLARTPVVYVDCYEVLGDAPRTVVEEALNADSDVVVNLGGGPPPAWLLDLRATGRIAVVQTNAEENDPGAARRQLNELTALDLADWVVVTAGRRGALGRGHGQDVLRAPAIDVGVRQVQGAGAAFSAALIHRRDAGAPLQDCLTFAAAAGSHWCGRSTEGPLPTADEISARMSRSACGSVPRLR